MLDAVSKDSARSSEASTFLLAGAAVSFSLVLVYFIGLDAVKSNQAISAQRETIERLNTLLSSVKDAETGQRGYLLTHDSLYLAPYRQALISLRTEEADLLAEAKVGRVSQADVQALVGLINDKLGELDETIQLASARGQPAAVARVRTGHGKALMDQVRARADGIRSALEADLNRTISRANTAVVLRSTTFLIIGMFNLAFLAWLYRRVHRETQEREALVIEHARAREVLETTLTSIGDGVIVTDSEGRVRFLNPEATELTGWSNDEAQTHPIREVFHIVNEQTRKEAPNPVERALREGRAVGLANHTMLIRKDDRELPIDDSAAPIHLPGGAMHGVVLVFRDVTQRRKAEVTAARLAGILTTSSDAILSKNLDGVIQTWNSGAEKIFGYRSEEIIGKPVAVIVPPDRMQEEESILKRLREGRASEFVDTVRLTKDGRSIHVSATVWPTRDHEGSVIGAAATYRDITERKRGEEAAARLAAIVETSVDAIVSKDLDGNIKTWNHGAQRMFGFQPEEIIGKPMAAIIPPDKIPEEREILTRLRNGKPSEKLDTVRVAKDGHPMHVSVSVWPVRDPEGQVIGAATIMVDVTERRKAEEALRAANDSLAAQRRLYNTILSNTPDLVYVFDLRHRFIYANDSLLKIWGKTWDEAIGKSCLELGYEPWHAERHDREIDRVIATKRPVRGEVPFAGTAGRRIYDYIFSPVIGKNGEVESIAGTTRDVTELRQQTSKLEVEVAARTAELRRSVEQLEAFSYTVSHDLRAPLRAIQGYAFLTLNHAQGCLNEEDAERLKRIEASSARMDRLVKDVLLFSQIGREQPTLSKIDLDPIVAHIVENYESIRSAKVRVNGPLGKVIGHETLLTQAISNLVDNAVKFVPKGRPPAVGIRAERAQGRVRLIVEDKGIGIPPEYQKRLFVPFVRLTSGKYAGTGIGLAIVKRSAETMRGQVGLTSEPGNGSRFWIELPEGNDES